MHRCPSMLRVQWKPTLRGIHHHRHHQQHNQIEKKQASRRVKLFVNDILNEMKSTESDICSKHGITPTFFQLSLSQFSHRFSSELIYSRRTQKLFELALREKDQSKGRIIMWDMFWKDCYQRYTTSDHTEAMMMKESQTDLQSMITLTDPQSWYSGRREMKRKIVVHTGAPNSGFAENTMKLLKSAKTGIYISNSSLRVHDKYNELLKSNIPAAILSSLDQKSKNKNHNTTHYCTTVDDADVFLLNSCYQVAVIDDAHFIADESRGWLWTRLLLGLNAKEIHLCGDDRIVHLIDLLCRDISGDHFSVHNYIHSIRPLHVSPFSIIHQSYSNVEPGDCIVVFLKRDLFKVKSKIERQSGLSVGVLYDEMPNSVHMSQCKLFNNNQRGYEVLVMTDTCVIVTELNVNRLLFHSAFKYDELKKNHRVITESEVMNIASSFHSSLFMNGDTCISFLRNDHCTVFHQNVTTTTTTSTSMTDFQCAGLLPTNQLLETFINHFYSNQSFIVALEQFYTLAKTDPSKYFLCNVDRQMTIVTSLESVSKLTVADRLVFMDCPAVKIESPTALKLLRQYAIHHSRGEVVPLMIDVPDIPPITIDQLRSIELGYKMMDVYLYFSRRFPTTFSLYQTAMNNQKRMEQLMNVVLSGQTTTYFMSSRFNQQQYF